MIAARAWSGLLLLVAAGMPHAQTHAAAAAIVGIVVDDQDRPLDRALVGIINDSGEQKHTILTGAAGRFAFEGLPQGVYHLMGQARNHATVIYGQRRPNLPDAPFDLHAGQRVTATLRLKRTAALTGVVRDASGEGLAGIEIHALRRYRHLGQVVGDDVATTATDRHGAYRVFDLAPGTYVISASAPTSTFIRQLRDSAGHSVTFAPLFYGGTTKIAEAEPIVLAPAEERTGIDLAFLPVEVSPPLRLADFQPPPPPMPPEEQVLKIPGIRGRVVFETAQGPSSNEDNARVVAVPTDPDYTSLRSVVLDPQGGFFLRLPLGDFMLDATAGSRGAAWTMKSVRIGDRDLTDRPITVGDEQVHDVVISMTDRLTEVSGTLRTVAGEPIFEEGVLFFPADRKLWPVPRRSTVAQPDGSGRFLVRGLPPGAYLVVVADVTDDDIEPALFERFLPAGIPLSLGEGEHKTQNLVKSTR